MRCVWSFWTAPLELGYGSGWATLKDLFLSCALSVEVARRHYSDTCLYTDTRGAHILIDRLGLEFESVSTAEFDCLNSSSAPWWALGKLYAYRAQDAPFVHIDNDVYIWEKLPSRLEEAGLFAQNIESFIVGESNWYLLDSFSELAASSAVELPHELKELNATPGAPQFAVCCGIFGGRDLSFINRYADRAISLVNAIQRRMPAKYSRQVQRHMVFVEQFFLAACVEYSRRCSQPPVHVEYLFSGAAAARASASAIGYTHLIGGAKKNPVLRQRLERRVAIESPALYERCMRYARELES